MNLQSVSAPSELGKFVPDPLCPNSRPGKLMQKRHMHQSGVLWMAIVVVGLGGFVSAWAQSAQLNPDLVAAKWQASWIASQQPPGKATTQVLWLLGEERRA
jgi:hypothetical protein